MRQKRLPNKRVPAQRRQASGEDRQLAVLVDILNEVSEAYDDLAHARSSIRATRVLLREVDNKAQAGALFMLLQLMENGIENAQESCSQIKHGFKGSAS